MEGPVPGVVYVTEDSHLRHFASLRVAFVGYLRKKIALIESMNPE